MAQPTSERFACSPATLPQPGGCSARGSSCRSARTKPVPTHRDHLRRRRPVDLRLPDLRGRLPIHQGNSFILAETGGAEEITLTVNQVPAHSHALLASSSASSLTDPGGNVSAQSSTFDQFQTSRGPPRWRRSPSRRRVAASRTPISSLSVRELHHLVVRDLLEPNLRRRSDTMADHSSPRSGSSLQLRSKGVGVL